MCHPKIRPSMATIRVDLLSCRGSILDIIQAVTNHDSGNASLTFQRMLKSHPSLAQKWSSIRINGVGRLTPVADVSTLIEVAMLCPGKKAEALRKSMMDVIVRLIRGDPTVAEEIVARFDCKSCSGQSVLLGAPLTEARTDFFDLVWDRGEFAKLLGSLSRNEAGVIYLATAPSLPFVKIGYWKGELRALKSRYMTVYGAYTMIWAFKSNQCVRDEKECHRRLAQYRLYNELFKAEHIEEYLKVVSSVCKPQIIV
jgi:hypothetical protein